MRRVLTLLLVAGAAAGFGAPASADPCCDPPCRLVWNKPTVEVDTENHTVTVDPGGRPQWIC